MEKAALAAMDAPVQKWGPPHQKKRAAFANRFHRRGGGQSNPQDEQGRHPVENAVEQQGDQPKEKAEPQPGGRGAGIIPIESAPFDQNFVLWGVARSQTLRRGPPAGPQTPRLCRALRTPAPTLPFYVKKGGKRHI